MADTISRMFLEKVRSQPEKAAQFAKGKNGYEAVSYASLFEQVKAIAAGLRELGVVRGDKVGIISDNRPEWLAVDQALLYCYQYNPKTGRYSASILNVVRVGGLLTLLALGGFILSTTRRSRGRAKGPAAGRTTH